MKYPGAKTVLVSEIKRVYKQSGCNTFIDVFAGSASVLLNIDSSRRIYNDINPDVYNIFSVLRNNFKSIYMPMENLAEDKETFFDFYDRRILFNSDDEKIENAFNSLFRLNTRFGGMGSTYGKKDKSLYGNFKKNIANLSMSESIIENMAVENLDFRELLSKYDSPKSFFYLDPPYPGKDWYSDGFTESDYMDLKMVLKKLQGKFLMNFNSGNQLIYKIFGKPLYKLKFENKNGKADQGNDREVDFYSNMKNINGNNLKK
ncbi:MAG: DNA adenine methylase [Ferroplasma sp.]